MGVLHFFIPLFAAQWGVVLIVLGILSLIITHRGMFIALGGALILVGLMNLVGSFEAGPGLWSVFGCLQVYWGIQEIIKFRKYANDQEAESVIEQEVLEGEPGK
jgi:uncharacterized membrane protein HdeD (DUF308 family)